MQLGDQFKTLEQLFAFTYLMEEERKKVRKDLSRTSDIKKWNQELIPKTILLLPPLAFVLTFLKINTNKSIIDLLGFMVIFVLLVSGGIFLNYLLSNGK